MNYTLEDLKQELEDMNWQHASPSLVLSRLYDLVQVLIRMESKKQVPINTEDERHIASSKEELEDAYKVISNLIERSIR